MKEAHRGSSNHETRAYFNWSILHESQTHGAAAWGSTRIIQPLYLRQKCETKKAVRHSVYATYLIIQHKTVADHFDSNGDACRKIPSAHKSYTYSKSQHRNALDSRVSSHCCRRAEPRRQRSRRRRPMHPVQH